MQNQKRNELGVFIGVSVGYLLFCNSLPAIFADSLAGIVPGNERSYYVALCLAAGLFFTGVLYHSFAEKVEWKKNISGRGVAEALLIGLVLFVGLNFILSPLLGRIFHASDANYNQNVVKMFETPVATFIQVVVVAPLLEELIYRGFLLKRQLRYQKTMTAVLFTAGFFGLLHMNLVQGISAFAAGILLCMFYVKRESIFLCILAHSFYNGITFLLTVM